MNVVIRWLQSPRAARRLATVFGALLLAEIAVVYFGAFGDGAYKLLDVVIFVGASAAAVLGAIAWRSAPAGRARRAWALIFLAFMSSALAEGVWAWYEIVLNAEVPYPSVSDFFYLSFYPLIFAGLLMLENRESDRLSSATVLFDALLFTLGFGGLVWLLVVQPSLEGVEVSLMALTLAYPVGDLLLVFALVALVMRMDMTGKKAVAAMLLMSFVSQVVADLGFTWFSLSTEYVTGSPVDPFWLLGYAAAGGAAFAQIKNAGVARSGAGEGGARVMRAVRMVIPYLVVPMAILMIVIQAQRGEIWGETGPSVAIVITLGLIVLVLVRQFLTLAENTRLSRSLEDLSKDLERRVTDRTRELAILNDTATALSRCLVTDGALRAGLEHACSASGARSGIAWLHRDGGGVELAASVNLSADASESLFAIVRHSRELTRMRSTLTPLAIDAATLSEVGGAAGVNDGELVMLVPLLARGAKLGGMALVEAPDSSDEQGLAELLLAVGAQVGVAVENTQQYERALWLAERDSVTGIRNHRALQHRLEEEVKRARRSGGVFSLVMIDLDGFKLFNDTYGHPGGDEALRHVASLISSTARGSDVVGRYGGDEFMVILTDTDGESALTFCERLRHVVADNPFKAPDGTLIPVRLSIGIASCPSDGHAVNELIGLADASLYSSKHHGGDQITSPTLMEERVEAGGGAMFGVLDGLVTAVDNKDRYTRRHSEDVTALALVIAQQLSLSEETQRALRIAGLLHDVGKIGVPDRILRKPGKLSDDEFDVIKQHATLGEAIVKEIPHLVEVMGAVGSHHERWDGRGYPRGLKGTEIPFLGRVLAVTDAWSAMTTDRPYRKGLTYAEAREEMRRVAGSQLDPDLVAAFLAGIDEESMRERDGAAWGAATNGNGVQKPAGDDQRRGDARGG